MKAIYGEVFSIFHFQCCKKSFNHWNYIFCALVVVRFKAHFFQFEKNWALFSRFCSRNSIQKFPDHALFRAFPIFFLFTVEDFLLFLCISFSFQIITRERCEQSEKQSQSHLKTPQNRNRRSLYMFNGAWLCSLYNSNRWMKAFSFSKMKNFSFFPLVSFSRVKVSFYLDDEFFSDEISPSSQRRTEEKKSFKASSFHAEKSIILWIFTLLIPSTSSPQSSDDFLHPHNSLWFTRQCFVKVMIKKILIRDRTYKRCGIDGRRRRREKTTHVVRLYFVWWVLNSFS